MRRSIVIGAGILLISLSQATAQNNTTGSQPTPPQKTTQPPLGAGEKIPPHKQPRAADVPSNAANQSPEDREMDRRLRGICRGC